MIFHTDPDQLVDPPLRAPRARRGDGPGRDHELGPGPGPGPRSLRGAHAAEDRSTRCSPARPNEAEREAIRTAMFGTVMDVIDRYLPDPVRHAQMRALLAFLSVNSTFRGPYTPGSAMCMAFALASPGDDAAMSKVRGGIGAMSDHVRDLFVANGGELRRHARVARILVADGRVGGVELADGETITAPVVVSNLDATQTFTELIDRELLPERVRPAGRRHRPPGRVLPDALRAERAARAHRRQRGAQRGPAALDALPVRHARGDAARLRDLPAGRGARRAAGVARHPLAARSRRSPPRASTRPARSRSTRRSASATRTRCACATRWPSGSWPASPPWPPTSPTPSSARSATRPTATS